MIANNQEPGFVAAQNGKRVGPVSLSDDWQLIAEKLALRLNACARISKAGTLFLKWKSPGLNWKKKRHWII
jgi:hypothetical protein